MSKALSVDLRTLYLPLSPAGLLTPSRRAIWCECRSVSRWRNLQIRQGNVRPGPLGGDRNSRKTEIQADLIMAWREQGWHLVQAARCPRREGRLCQQVGISSVPCAARSDA